MSTALSSHGGPHGRQDFASETFVTAFGSKDHGADAEVDLSPTLRAGGHDGSHANAGVPPAIAYNITPSNSNKDYNARLSERAQAVTAGGNRPSARGGDLIAFDTTQVTSVANRSNPQPGDPCHPLAAGAHPPTVAGTVRSHTRPGSNEVGSIVTTSAVRRLTPRECERLQGFPDDFTLIPWRSGLAPDGPRYKALGNSMAVPVMAWIGQRVAAVDVLQGAR